MLPYFVLVYAVCSIGLLLAYQRTRLFPLYLLKCAWTFFTIMAFLWVVAMSFAENSEYIRHPSGPFAILIGEPVQNAQGILVLEGGYPGALRALTGTEPTWVVAALFCMWMTWGFLLPRHGTAGGKSDAPKGLLPATIPVREAGGYPATAVSPRYAQVGTLAAMPLNYASPAVPLEPASPGGPWWLPLTFLIPVSLALSVLLLIGSGRRDATWFIVVLGLWWGLAILARPLFIRWGGWLLGGALLIAALPILRPFFTFDWSRYGFAGRNYSSAWVGGNLGQYFINSMMVTLTAVALTTLLGSMAAYVLARRPLAGRSVVFGGIIASITVPGILIQVPLFLLIKDWSFKLHGLPYRFAFMDSRFGLAMIYTALSLPFTIYVLTGFFRTLPGELGEASVIDGCSQWKTFTQIYLPLALPGIATTGIFNFLGAWNEFNLGMIFMSNPNFKTLPIGLYELQAATQYSSAWAPLFAGIVLLCLPTFLIFVFLQERIVAGLTSGGVKG